MQIADMVRETQDAITVRRVFAEPYEVDGVTVIAAAKVGGGAGGGGGHDEKGDEGEGGGFGVQARPAGVYVVRNGDVQWRPAVDVNRALTAMATVLVVAMITRARIARARMKSAGRRERA